MRFLIRLTILVAVVAALAASSGAARDAYAAVVDHATAIAGDLADRASTLASDLLGNNR